ncbi:hypothetical protein [Glaesserella parasuis]|uniref:Uncharacterized protein n=2 Tax=Glaesserella parasuis TaxID=738 RepID=A0A836MEK5_GLAPU|nr:hypothetical protein [Glaesserella parasuis]KDB47975.1 hypothetical protein HPS11_07260 [Glaesserella parasuis HPS11]KDB48059.1 hypothetical protein HPS10_05285 [Glaesserella parasuis HPS10]MCT8526479.1 hypothetical protein [Glaesserella parasuis]MCT8528651.1 hypothetical protein [Glaesserella parasuis]MCT8530693.1 hypothetical protein [Glaesserella parasuis]
MRDVQAIFDKEEIFSTKARRTQLKKNIKQKSIEDYIDSNTEKVEENVTTSESTDIDEVKKNESSVSSTEVVENTTLVSDVASQSSSVISNLAYLGGGILGVGAVVAAISQGGKENAFRIWDRVTGGNDIIFAQLTTHLELSEKHFGII